MKTTQLTIKQRTLNITLVTAFTLSVSASQPVYASNYDNESQVETDVKTEQNEVIGLGIGTLVGAIFGGPAGAFITGIAGGFIAKSVDADENINSLELALNEQQQLHQQEVALFQQKLTHNEMAYQKELLALEQGFKDLGQIQAENLLMSLQFSTGSSTIAHHYNEQIVALAQLLQKSPKMNIDLSGYTDLQGDEKRNHHLSLARVNSVKNALISHGVEPARIQTFAYGEDAPVVANAQQESSFYDRRVVVKLHQDSNQMANNH